jgi:hypothetical protein
MQDDEPKPRAIGRDGDWPGVESSSVRVAVFNGKVECGLRHLARDDHTAHYHGERGEPESRGDKQMLRAWQRRYRHTGEHVGRESCERGHHEMGSQHIDCDWLHGFVSWPDERIVRLPVGSQRPRFDAFVSKKKDGHYGHAPAVNPSMYLRFHFGTPTTKGDAAYSCRKFI